MVRGAGHLRIEVGQRNSTTRKCQQRVELHIPFDKGSPVCGTAGSCTCGSSRNVAGWSMAIPSTSMLVVISILQIVLSHYGG